MAADLRFKAWGRRWIELAGFKGRILPDEEGRINALIALWQEEIPGEWQREQDARLLDVERRYCRKNDGLEDHRCGEHVIEYDLLHPPTDGTRCLGARLVDGVNAVPLAKDVGGGKNGNVEADVLLLVHAGDEYRLLLTEVKNEWTNAWYAAVENLRQLKLFSESMATQRLFHTRCPELNLPHPLPMTGVVLAPPAFYSANGARGEAIAPAERLLDRMRNQLGVDARLATWHTDERAMKAYVAGGEADRRRASVKPAHVAAPSAIPGMRVMRRAQAALVARFGEIAGDVLDTAGRAPELHQAIVRTIPDLALAQALADVRQGDGGELVAAENQRPKFHSAYSSCALALNVFAMWRLDPSSLSLGGHDPFESLRFEAKCPIFAHRAIPPNLDALLETNGDVVGVESKLTEYLAGRQTARFASRYDAAIRDFADAPWQEMYRLLVKDPVRYRWLNAAQLVKHALGLSRYAEAKRVTLIYLYWEPANASEDSTFSEHRDEIRDFATIVSGSDLLFEAIDYPSMWNQWAESDAGDEALQAHVHALQRRYDVQI